MSSERSQHSESITERHEHNLEKHLRVEIDLWNEMAFRNEKITILYGSQTGNAQEVAERLWRESRRYRFRGPVLPMDEYDVSDLPTERCLLLICSTTGQGDEPDNMRRFWRYLLRKNLPPNCLSHLRFAVLGLGDSGYLRFNFTAKRLNKRLIQLGAEAIQAVGLGDDQHDLGYDAVADPWIDSLMDKLVGVYPLPKDVEPLSKGNGIMYRWNVTTKLLENKEKPQFLQQSIYYSTKPSNEFYVTVLSNKRQTSQTHFQDVRLIKLRTNCEPYGPGDVVVLRPRNLPSQIKEFRTVLKENNANFKSDSIFTIKQATSDIPVPDPLRYEVSFDQLCEEFFDLTATPRRYTFSVLASLTDNELEREKCLEFCSSEGQEAMYSYATRPKRTIIEVLHDFPHATRNLTKEALFEIFPPIKPRDFSIASSYKSNQSEIHILVAVVKYRTGLKKERLGLCSNYLADLKENDRISVWIKKGTFKFPSESSYPVIMVGPGTGIAPFRNYVHDRASEGTATKESLLLFFGCRGQGDDFFCKDEWQNFQNTGKLNFFAAFSRDQPYKIYVQHKIKEQKALVWKMLQSEKCYVFVAGNSKHMPKDVWEAFVYVCEEEGKMSKEEAEEFMQKMEKSRRYQQEVWF